MLSGLDINIKKSNRKTVSIYVERDGTISILAPNSIEDGKLKEVIKQKEYQIYQKHAEWELFNTSRVNREYVNGQSYLYLGRNYRLEFVDKQSEPLMLKNGYFNLLKNELKNADNHFKEFYKLKGLPIIQRKINEYQLQLGVNPGNIKVMELKNRWASCSVSGNINFHWKCIMAPTDVISYLVVHELVHLIYKNHSASFWNEVDKVIPNYQRHIEWLKLHGASMNL